MKLSIEYLETQKKFSEQEILEKTVEEAEELLAAARSLMKDSSNATARENFMEEFMDVRRMVTVWIEKYATEQEKNHMQEQDQCKIDRFVEKNRTARTSSWKDDGPDFADAVAGISTDTGELGQ